MTYLEALQWANQTLRTSGAEASFASPMLDAELLLCAATTATRSTLFLRLDVPLKLEDEARFRGFVDRRAAYEPIAYILGEKPFRSFSLSVSPAVLIPRPATETLVDAAIALIRNSDLHPAPCTLHPLFADIGTGSGAIAISLAKETGCHVLATDLSREALEVAKENAKQNNVDQLIDFLAGDGLRPILSSLREASPRATNAPVHFILCANLPYLPNARWDELAPDIRLFEPRSALTAGTGGLDRYVELFRDLRAARSAFPTQLSCVIEIDPTQTASASALIRGHFPAARISIVKDLEGFDRVVVAMGI